MKSKNIERIWLSLVELRNELLEVKNEKDLMDLKKKKDDIVEFDVNNSLNAVNKTENDINILPYQKLIYQLFLRKSSKLWMI